MSITFIETKYCYYYEYIISRVKLLNFFNFGAPRAPRQVDTCLTYLPGNLTFPAPEPQDAFQYFTKYKKNFVRNCVLGIFQLFFNWNPRL